MGGGAEEFGKETPSKKTKIASDEIVPVSSISEPTLVNVKLVFG